MSDLDSRLCLALPDGFANENRQIRVLAQRVAYQWIDVRVFPLLSKCLPPIYASRLPKVRLSTCMALPSLWLPYSSHPCGLDADEHKGPPLDANLDLSYCVLRPPTPAAR